MLTDRLTPESLVHYKLTHEPSDLMILLMFYLEKQSTFMAKKPFTQTHLVMGN